MTPAAAHAASGPTDRLWIDVSEDAAVQRWADSFGVTPQELLVAVAEAGDRADAVQEHLTGIPALPTSAPKYWH